MAIGVPSECARSWGGGGSYRDRPRPLADLAGYVQHICKLLAARPSVQIPLTAADEKLAAALWAEQVPLEQIERAIELACTRKHVSWATAGERPNYESAVLSWRDRGSRTQASVLPRLEAIPSCFTECSAQLPRSAPSLELPLYDGLIRRALNRAGVWNQVVFCDLSCYIQDIQSQTAALHAGRQYSVTPIWIKTATKPPQPIEKSRQSYREHAVQQVPSGLPRYASLISSAARYFLTPARQLSRGCPMEVYARRSPL